MANHNAAARLAPARDYPEDAGEVFLDGLQRFARRLIFSARGATEADRQFLQDVARPGDVRYAMKALRRLAALAAMSDAPIDQEALAELCHALVQSNRRARQEQRPKLTLIVDRKIEVHAHAEVAERQFERHADRVSREILKENLIAELALVREELDVVEANGFGD